MTVCHALCIYAAHSACDLARSIKTKPYQRPQGTCHFKVPVTTELTKEFIPKSRNSRLIVVAGSGADKPFVDEAAMVGEKFGIANVVKRISSAHKSTAEALEMIAEYEGEYCIFKLNFSTVISF